jgi:predicted TIM-barrel fold metal-dependent hydrolase
MFILLLEFPMTIIDFHAHAFPDALAPRAIAQLTINAATSGYIPLTDGTTHGLIESMDRAGIHRSVVCNIATNAKQMTKVNDFAISCASNHRLIPLGSLHPGVTAIDMDNELDRLAGAGLAGIKIHPDYVHTEIDSPAFEPILARCEARGMLVVTHAGFDPVEPKHIHCTPEMVLRVMERHPALKLVVAHTGGFDCEREVLEKLCGTKVYLDTSLAAVRKAKSVSWGEACGNIIRAHDSNRILFATDTPWSDPVEEIAFVRGIGLSEENVEKIFHVNAEKLLASCIK